MTVGAGDGSCVGDEGTGDGKGVGEAEGRYVG
jgi:hypothetical protein